MFANPQEQLFIFLMCVICGIGTGIFYDLFKVIRRLAKPSLVTVGIQDGLFWILAAGGIFTFLLVVDNGRLRFYELSTIFIVWLIYALTVSRYTVKAGVFIITKTAALILLPIKLICKIFKKPFFIVVSISRKGFKRVGRILSQTGKKWCESAKKLQKNA